MATSGADLLVIAYRGLSEEERTEAFERIRDLRLEVEAGTDSEMGRYLASLRRVAEAVGGMPTVDEYKSVAPELVKAGESIESFGRLYRFFGSWPRAREAYEMSDSTTAKQIEARFRSRTVDKVWRYTPETLRECLVRAAEHYGRPPSVAEFDWWRDRELQLMQAAGHAAPHLPSTGPYRRRYKTWERALLHHGFTEEQVAERFERGENPRRHEPDAYLPEGLPIATLADPGSTALPLDADAVARLRASYDGLPKRSQYVLTVRYGLGGSETLTLAKAAEPLGLHLDRVRQLQVMGTQELCRAVAIEKGAEPGLVGESVLATLTALAVLPEA